MPEPPGPLSVGPPFPFVGRATELVMPRSLLPLAKGEGRRLALVGGEAGSGKSRLVREFAAEAAERGALVMHGACDAVVHPPYGPCVEAFDHLARAVEPEELRGAGGALARLGLPVEAAEPAADP